MLRTLIRKLRELVVAGDVAKSEEAFRVVQKKLDQSAAKGVIHRNKAARLKARLSYRIKVLKGKGPAGAAAAAPAPAAS